MSKGVKIQKNEMKFNRITTKVMKSKKNELNYAKNITKIR